MTDIGSQRLVELSLDNASVLGQLNLANLNLVDFSDLITGGGGFIFVLAAQVVPQILVINARFGIARAVLVQRFDVSVLGVGFNAQGLALLF